MWYVPEYFRKQNWKTEKLFFPETSRERFSIKKQFFSFLVLSPEMFRKSSVSKTEKLKNWKTVFSREIQGEILHKKTVFQFFSFVSGNVPEYFRKQNWKTEKLFFPETSRERFSIKKQFFSFLVLSPEMFRKSSVSKTEKLKNWKTVSRDIQGEILHKKTAFQFFSFVSGNVPEYFRKQNWKTEKLFFPETSRERFSIKNSFSVFQFFSFVSGNVPEEFHKQNWKTSRHQFFIW